MLGLHQPYHLNQGSLEKGHKGLTNMGHQTCHLNQRSLGADQKQNKSPVIQG